MGRDRRIGPYMEYTVDVVDNGDMYKTDHEGLAYLVYTLERHSMFRRQCSGNLFHKELHSLHHKSNNTAPHRLSPSNSLAHR